MFVKILHLFHREVIVPIQWLATLTIFDEGRDDLPDARRAFLERADPDVGELGIDLGVLTLELIFQLLRIHDV